MKISKDTSPVEIDGAVSEPQQFRISASKEAFKILSSNLYNNKKLAVIRELCCNSWDAHVAAGKKDVPFEIHLPTPFEPHFSVKDNGVGLSHEEILSLYTTYFGTNKADSNDFVGALGLGSKSPFCYTEGFSIISRFNGKTKTYSCFIGETGTPTVLLQAEEDTPGEQNGLEVQFPVKQSDCWEFENAAKIALEFFDPQPILNVDLNINKCEYEVKSEKWGLRKNITTHHTSKIRAIQGMVQYAVGNIDSSRLDKDQEQLINLPLDLFFPIGELSVTPSREILSNDERTIGNILKMLDQVGVTLIEEIKAKLAQCKTVWDARLLLYSLGNTQGIGKLVNHALREGKLDGVYKQFTLSKNPPSINEVDYLDVSFYTFTKSWNRGGGTSNKSKLSTEKVYLKGQSQLSGFKREYYNISFDTHPETVFIIDDLGFGGEKYIHYFLQEAQDNRGEGMKKTVYLIQRGSKEITTAVVTQTGKKIIEALGFPPVQLLSDMKARYKPLITEYSDPKPYVKRDSVYFNTEAYLSRGSSGTARKWRDAWVPTFASKPTSPKKNYYVVLKNQVPQFGEDDFYEYADSFKSFIHCVKTAKVFDFGEDDVVYGVTEKSPFRNDSNWVEFTSHVFSKLNKYMTPEKELMLSLYIKPFSTRFDSVLEAIAVEKVLDKNSPMQKFCDELATLKRFEKAKLSALSMIINKAGYKVKNVTDFSKIWEKVQDKYPMLKLVDDYRNPSGKKKAIIEYVKMVDEKRIEEKKKKSAELEILKEESILLEEKENIVCQ